MISLKNYEEIEIMALAGKKLAEVVFLLKKEIKPGIKTKILDELAYKLIIERGAYPAFLNYAPSYNNKPFPASLCVSVNDTIVHGLPSDYILQPGDVVKLDIGLKYNGFYADMAETIGIPPLGKDEERLIIGTKEALQEAIKLLKPGNTLGDIGYKIESIAKKYNLSVAEKLTGHGIGRNLHEDPYVLNVGKKGEGLKLRSGMVLAIEPMFILGKKEVIEHADGSFKSKDKTKTAHFEHTIAVLENGPKILTQL
jgi:methionyl aminopeptidase